MMVAREAVMLEDVLNSSAALSVRTERSIPPSQIGREDRFLSVAEIVWDSNNAGKNYVLIM